MRISPKAIDYSAVIILCLLGLGLTLSILMAGSPQYGLVSTLWRSVGIQYILGFTFIAFLVAGLILRGMWRKASCQPRGLLAFAGVSIIPFAWFLVILAARIVHGE